MHIRRVTKEGRVNVPAEYLKIFRINEDDLVEVSMNRTSILIKKHRDTEICVITGKASKHLNRIGDAFISTEGLAILKEALREKGQLD